MRSPLFFALALALGSATLLAPIGADAQSMSEVRATAQASMVLTGSISITADGKVDTLALDQRKKLSPAILSFVDNTIRSWTFEPVQVDGKAVAAHAPMRIRLQSRPLPDGTAEVAMKAVDFSEYDDKSTDTVTRGKMPPPRYPEAALATGGQGEVVLLVKVGRNGKVADVIAEQVNMTVAAPERDMQKLRKILADASINATRRWSFTPPTTGADKDAEFWTIRVPVSYSINTTGMVSKERYGQWQAYIPGPRQVAPWRDKTDTAAEVDSADLLPAGGVYMVDSAKRGLRLLTPLGNG